MRVTSLVEEKCSVIEIDRRGVLEDIIHVKLASLILDIKYHRVPSSPGLHPISILCPDNHG